MTNNTTGQERALSDRDKVDALAKALCLLDSFAGDGLGHVYGNGQTLDADDVCLELAQAFDLEFDAGWWRTVAERALIGAPFPNSRKSRDAFIEAIREAAPNGEEIAVRYHANNDWSVANAPLYSLPHQPATGGGKGCPFCGGDDLLTGIQFGHDGVECKSCGAIGPRGDDADDAQERWKKRALSTTPPHTAETRLREVLERIADECEGTAPNGEPVGIASKCHRIARAALTQPEPTAQGGEEGEIVLGLRQARHVLKDLQAKNSDQTAYGKLAQTCDIAADRLTALSAQQGGEEERAAELIRSYFDARQAGNDCPECGNEGPWEHCGPCSDRIGPVIARMSNFAINMDMHGEIAEGADKRDAVARIISLAKGAPENGQMSIGAWWWDKRHDRARPEHFEGECRDEDRKHADLMIPLLRAALSAQQAAGEAEAVDFNLSPHDDPAFVEAWMDMEAKGYLYTESSIEKVHLGWLLARSATPQPTETQRIIAAYIEGATAVHEEWCRAHELGEGPPRGDPEFGEAASDYAASIASIAKFDEI